MRLREVYLSDREQLGVTATRIWNLDLSDPIMFIKLRFEALTDYAAGCNGNRLPDCVSKIEFVMVQMFYILPTCLRRWHNTSIPGMKCHGRINGIVVLIHRTYNVVYGFQGIQAISNLCLIPKSS